VALAAKIQQRYNAIKDIQGEFVQSYEGGVLRTRTTERGTVAIKRPGRMRFLYTKPEKKEFVSDGNRLYAYMVADKQVIVSPAPGPDQGDIPASRIWRATTSPPSLHCPALHRGSSR
jgi:outer membrane lipoprotein carrier protein